MKTGEKTRKTGEHYETEAVSFLEERGYHILQRNYCCRIGEIDIIAREGEYLVVVEVKYRRTGRTADAGAAEAERNQKTISKVADYYMMNTICTRIRTSALMS